MLRDLISRNTAMPAIMKSMNTAMLRSRVIANNIANVTTPGYKRESVSFEEELSKALDKTKLKGTATNSRHMKLGRKDISNVKPHVYRPADPTLPSGVNNVDIDTEMAKLAENQLMFNIDVKFMKNNYSKIGAAIQGKSMTIQ